MQAIHQDLRETHITGSGSREWRLAVGACPAMSLCQMLYAGWTEAASGYSFVRLTCPFCGLIVCDGGAGEVLVEGKWRECRAGQAYLLPRGPLHAYHARRRGRWSICWVAFDRRVEGSLFGSEPELVDTDPRPLRSAIEGLQREVNGPGEPAAIQQWVALIRLYALRIAGEQHEDRRLHRLWEQVDGNLAFGWTLGHLCELAGTSGEHLRRLCQRQYDCSPMAHVARLRMRRAAALLLAGGQKVAVIGRAVGYENPFAFSSCFRRHMGVSPAGYRSRRS